MEFSFYLSGDFAVRDSLEVAFEDELHDLCFSRFYNQSAADRPVPQRWLRLVLAFFAASVWPFFTS